MVRAIKVSRETLARAARMYRFNQDAAKALGINNQTFTNYCERFGIETPSARLRRLTAEEARARK